MRVVFIGVVLGRGGRAGGAASCIVGRSMAEEGSGVTGTDQICRFGEDLLVTSRTGSSKPGGE